MKKSGFGLRKIYSQKNKLDLGMGVFEQEKKVFSVPNKVMKENNV